MKEAIKNKKGITLIALVITIIVLIILAGITIATLTGDNGILTKATESKEKTAQAKAEEMVSVAIGGLQTENLGDTSKITPEAIANQVMKDNNIENVIAEDSTFPTNIIFESEGLKVGVDLPQSYKIYDVEINESDIAPVEIFNYEIIENEQTEKENTNNLPTKEVRITSFKVEYCNHSTLHPDTGEEIGDTNYEIKLKDGTIITDLLVIPYEVEGKYVNNGIAEEKYKITEVNLGVYYRQVDKYGPWTGYGLPSGIKTIVYPNTVKKISGNSYQIDKTGTISEVILPNNLREIGSKAFYGYSNLTSITIPDTVTNIEEGAFSRSGLTSIEIPEKVNRIERSTFELCSKLTSITIPESVKSIGYSAFYLGGR